MASEPTKHVERKTEMANGKTFCSCGDPWPCKRRGIQLECYVIYDRQRKKFYNYTTGRFGAFADASLFDDPDLRDLIPMGEDDCVVMKVTATAEMVTP